MSYTAVKKTDGLSVIASNTLLDTGASPHVVSNDVLDTIPGAHTVFGATVAVTPLTIVEFDLLDNRIFSL